MTEAVSVWYDVRKTWPDIAGLKMEEGATSQGMQAASRSCETHGNRFSPRASGREWGLTDTLALAHLKPFQTSNLQNCEFSKSVLFWDTEFAAMCYSGHGKLTGHASSATLSRVTAGTPHLKYSAFSEFSKQTPSVLSSSCCAVMVSVGQASSGPATRRELS